MAAADARGDWTKAVPPEPLDLVPTTAVKMAVAKAISAAARSNATTGCDYPVSGCLRC